MKFILEGNFTTKDCVADFDCAVSLKDGSGTELYEMLVSGCGNLVSSLYDTIVPHILKSALKDNYSGIKKEDIVAHIIGMKERTLDSVNIEVGKIIKKHLDEYNKSK